MKDGASKYIKAYCDKWKELKVLGYRSGTSWGEVDRTAIVQGEYPNAKIVGYLNRDLSIVWVSEEEAKKYADARASCDSTKMFV